MKFRVKVEDCQHPPAALLASVVFPLPEQGDALLAVRVRCEQCGAYAAGAWRPGWTADPRPIAYGAPGWPLANRAPETSVPLNAGCYNCAQQQRSGALERFDLDGRTAWRCVDLESCEARRRAAAGSGR